MTYRELFEYGKTVLFAHEIADCHTDAWLLLQFVTGMSRAVYLMDADRTAKAHEEARYRQCVLKRAGHYPLQYITHEQSFMGIDFYVDERVLVPRQDTEVLVETVLKYLQDDASILDMCTGSGCILLSLAANRRLASGIGADLSEDALAVAQWNAKKLQAKSVQFIQSDLFKNIPAFRFDMIVSNPPYIESDVIEALMPEVRDHEPVMALDGMSDGLYFYRAIAAQASGFLKSEGMLFFEIGYNQGEAVKRLLEDAGFEHIYIKKDLSGLDRVVYGTLRENK